MYILSHKYQLEKTYKNPCSDRRVLNVTFKLFYLPWTLFFLKLDCCSTWFVLARNKPSSAPHSPRAPPSQIQRWSIDFSDTAEDRELETKHASGVTAKPTNYASENLPCTHSTLVFLSQKKSIKKRSTWKTKILKKGKKRQVKNSPLVGTKAVFPAFLKTTSYHTLSYHSAFEPLSKAIHIKQIWSQPRSHI